MRMPKDHQSAAEVWPAAATQASRGEERRAQGRAQGKGASVTQPSSPSLTERKSLPSNHDTLGIRETNLPAPLMTSGARYSSVPTRELARCWVWVASSQGLGSGPSPSAAAPPFLPFLLFFPFFFFFSCSGKDGTKEGGELRARDQQVPRRWCCGPRQPRTDQSVWEDSS